MKILFSIILFMFFGFSADSQKKSNSKKMLTYDEKLYSSIKYRQRKCYFFSIKQSQITHCDIGSLSISLKSDISTNYVTGSVY